mgnify:CR=1 FL=1
MATSPDQTVYFNGYHNRSPGLGSVGAYQVAGTPYLTASNVGAGLEVQITFPALPRSITIINKDAANDDLHRPHPLYFSSSTSWCCRLPAFC